MGPRGLGLRLPSYLCPEELPPDCPPQPAALVPGAQRPVRVAAQLRHGLALGISHAHSPVSHRQRSQAPRYLVQKVLQVAGLQVQPGHPLGLGGIQVCEDGGIVVPGDAVLREIKLIDEAEDISAGTERLAGHSPSGASAGGLENTCGHSWGC